MKKPDIKTKSSWDFPGTLGPISGLSVFLFLSLWNIGCAILAVYLWKTIIIPVLLIFFLKMGLARMFGVLFFGMSKVNISIDSETMDVYAKRLFLGKIPVATLSCKEKDVLDVDIDLFSFDSSAKLFYEDPYLMYIQKSRDSGKKKMLFPRCMISTKKGKFFFGEFLDRERQEDCVREIKNTLHRQNKTAISAPLNTTPPDA